MKKILLLFFLSGYFSVFSQITTSKIKGLVTDKLGEPLFGANISVIHLPSGTLSGAISQENGRYTVANLRVGGPYKVTLSYVGFKTYKVDNIFLALGETTVINGALSEQGEELEEIVISSVANKTFNSDRTGAQTNISTTQLKTLPSISRSASDFTRLEPTASNGSFGGRNDQFNNFSLDGSIFNNPFGLDTATPGGQTDSQPISLDAIEQISVSVAPYDVTLSGFTGASVDAVTKSGTNQFTGTVYGFYRNQDLTGGKIEGENVIKPKLSQNQYGISLGGHILKDKLFFFANFEKDSREDLGTNGWIPNNNNGILTVNESSVLESDMIAVSTALSNLGYNSGAYRDFTYQSESTKGIFKLDWNITQKHRIALIYNFLRASKEKPAHPTALGLRGPNANILQFENSGYEINNFIDSFLLEVNSNFNEKTSNKLQIGYTFFDDFRNSLSSPAPSIIIENGSGSNYIIAGHEPFSINNLLEQRVFQLTNNMNFYKGDHTFTVGFSFEKFMFYNSFNLGTYGGTFGFDVNGTPFNFSDDRNFTSVDEFLSFANPGGLIDNLINGANTIFNNSNKLEVGAKGGWALAETNVGQLAFYIQDEWEANNNFKFSFGLRFDKPLFFDTREKVQENIDRKGTYQPDNIYFDPVKNQPTTLNSLRLPNKKWLLSPRLGFNWSIRGQKRLQIRGGTGVFTGRLPFVWLGNQVQGVDFFFYQTVDQNFKFPQVWKSSIGTDIKLEKGLVLTADISYAKDINGPHVQNWGLKPPSGFLNAPGDNRPIYTNSDKAVDQFGGFTNAYVFTNSDKGRIFNTSFKVEKTFKNGLYTTLAYSYLNSKDVNSIEAEITGDAFGFNPVAANANNDVLSYSKYGDTHRIIGIVSKKFSYGAEKFATTIAAFFEYAKGGRFSYTYGGDINNDGSSVNDLLYVPTVSELNQMQFSSATEQEAFENYIQQDKYLSSIRGSYVKRYGALAPWTGKWDVRILQDFNFETLNKRQNTVQLSVDILNLGNLINSNWGVVKQPNNVQPLGVSFPDADPNPEVYLPDYSQSPTYSFNPSLSETFGANSSLLSRWQMQIGLRYIF
ncbi:MAG: carboxypeptidase regulatory-like domain-containing protein [Tenacibaculum sp.]